MMNGENQHLADNPTLNEHRKAPSEASTRELPILANHPLSPHDLPPPLGCCGLFRSAPTSHLLSLCCRLFLVDDLCARGAPAVGPHRPYRLLPGCSSHPSGRQWLAPRLRHGDQRPWRAPAARANHIPRHRAATKARYQRSSPTSYLTDATRLSTATSYRDATRSPTTWSSSKPPSTLLLRSRPL